MPPFKPLSLSRLITLLPSLVSLLLILMVPPSAYATGATQWTSRISGADQTWIGVTYGNGLFVAVSSNAVANGVMTSPDGITWTLRTSASTTAWQGVTYGNGLFVAVATNKVMTSPDGITWTPRISANNNTWQSVTYGNGLFVAVAISGTNNRVMTSPDGFTWTPRTSAANNTWYGVTYGNGLFVAVATSGTNNRVMTSPDGITWTTQTSANNNNWRSVTYGNGLFVATAGGGTIAHSKVMTSPDGITWTTRTSPEDQTWYSVTYGNGLFVAVATLITGAGGHLVMTSPDGINWTVQTSASNNNWFGVTYGNGLFVAVAQSGTNNRVMTSPAVDAPTLSAISPVYGVTAGGTAVTLTGSSFTGATAVSLGGTAATNVTVLSDTSLTATTPAHAAGTASVLVTTPGGTNAANLLFNYTNCGPGVPITTGTDGVGSLWQMLALPCVPTSGSGTIAGVFGNSPATRSNLTTANYAINQAGVAAANLNGWIIEDRTVGAVPAYEPLLTSDLALNVGTGYWIKSYQAPTGGLLAMDGTTTPAAVTQLEGCYSANGCKAITVTTYKAGASRYNLVGNPFAFAIDWTKVRVRVDGSSSTLTPSAASAAGYMSNAVNIWNGTGYVAFTDVTFTSTPNLQYFKSFWVNVLPGAFGHTVELLIPAEQSTQPIVLLNPVAPVNLEQLASIEMPWYMGWLDWVVSPATAAVPVVKTPVKPQALPNFKDWSIRLKVNNPVTGWQDNGNLLGQLSDAQVGYDNHDVPEMTPFAAPYLTLVFPHQNWLTNAADYCGDFHSPSKKVDSWTFEIRANPVGSQVFLNWAGEAALLKRSRLIDAATGKVIKPSDKRWAKNGYPITLKKDVQRYIWKVLAK